MYKISYVVYKVWNQGIVSTSSWHTERHFRVLPDNWREKDTMKYDLCPFCGFVVFIITETVCDELGYIYQQDVGWECFGCGNYDTFWLRKEPVRGQLHILHQVFPRLKTDSATSKRKMYFPWR